MTGIGDIPEPLPDPEIPEMPERQVFFRPAERVKPPCEMPTGEIRLPPLPTYPRTGIYHPAFSLFQALSVVGYLFSLIISRYDINKTVLGAIFMMSCIMITAIGTPDRFGTSKEEWLQLYKDDMECHQAEELLAQIDRVQQILRGDWQDDDFDEDDQPVKKRAPWGRFRLFRRRRLRRVGSHQRRRRRRSRNSGWRH